jgi:uncharacterized membrane protein YdjX (TVP38/TMEM64 family)
LAIVAVRVVPVAPFMVVNLVAGSSRIGVRDFTVGTALGMTPGIAALALTTDSVVAAVREPSLASTAVAASLIVGAVLGLRALGNLLKRTVSHEASTAAEAAHDAE